MAKGDKIEYVDVEGVRCQVKNPKRRAVVQHYQNKLLEAIDNYISKVDRWSEDKRRYCEGLKVNVKIAPFTLGWLKRPEDENEYKVIQGRITLMELEGSRNIKGKTKKVSAKKPAQKKTTEPKKTVEPKIEVKKPAAPQKPSSPKKPTAPKKPNIKSITKQDSPKKKQDSNWLTKGSVKDISKLVKTPKKPVDTNESKINKDSTKGSKTAKKEISTKKVMANKKTITKKADPKSTPKSKK